MKRKQQLATLLVNELSLYTKARKSSDHNSCFKHLSRAHIISQERWFHHFYIHLLMFEYSWNRKDFSEIKGQLLRLIVTIPGHIIGKVPTGNIGWATVGLTTKMPIPDDLNQYFKNS